MNLLTHAHYFLDTDTKSISEIQKETDFKPIKNGRVQLGFTSSSLWLKANVYNPLPKEISKTIMLSYRELDYVDFYELDSTSLLKTTLTGDMRRTTHPEQAGLFPKETFHVPPGATRTIFIKVKSSSPIYFECNLYDPFYFLRYVGFLLKILYLFIGIHFIRLIINLILSRFVREKVFNYYTLALSIIFIGIAINTIDFKWIIGPRALNIISLLVYIFVPISFSLFTYHILHHHMKRNLYRISFYLFCSICIVGSGLSLLFYTSSPFVQFIYICYLLSLIILFSISVFQMIAYKNLRYEYLIPSLLLIIYSSLYTGIGLNILPNIPIVIIIIVALGSMEVMSMPLILGIILKKSYKRSEDSIRQLYETRSKISADLHDEIGSALTQISLESDLVKNNIYNEKDREDALINISTTSRKIIQNMSDIVWSVNTKNDSYAHLIDRMKDYAENIFKPLSITPAFEISGIDFTQNIDTKYRQELFYIFKEALNNILKHSKPDFVKINLHGSTDHFNLTIENDINQEPRLKSMGGNGISNMKDRANKIGATLDVIKDGNTFILKISNRVQGEFNRQWTMGN